MNCNVWIYNEKSMILQYIGKGIRINATKEVDPIFNQKSLYRHWNLLLWPQIKNYEINQYIIVFPLQIGYATTLQ